MKTNQIQKAVRSVLELKVATMDSELKMRVVHHAARAVGQGSAALGEKSRQEASARPPVGPLGSGNKGRRSEEEKEMDEESAVFERIMQRRMTELEVRNKRQEAEMQTRTAALTPKTRLMTS